MHYDDDIVIVGVGCQFPGANNLRDFWRVLSNGENHVKEIPKDRWNVDAFYDPDINAPGKTYVRKAGLVDRFEEWDHQFFGINDKEAEVMDPQQRMILDCVHMALEEGGITRKDIDGTNSGVYIGIMNDDYKNFVGNDVDISSNYSVTGTHRSITSARVSYCYNLYGPAITIDTACSSSLVAINLGSQALRAGECDVAICGGANTILDPNVFIMLSKARMLSPTGQCQTYSKNADGYARGEGCGIIILKRLKDAIKDGNKIRARILSSSNQDGHATTPITAPSGKQQTELLKRIYTRNKIDKQKVQVIEAHGTGTPVGDPIEANALGQFFHGSASSKSIYIGSVKTNIGHLEAAAGVAGLIKLLLMMEHGTLVPSLMYSKEMENPAINFDTYNFKVPTSTMEWKSSSEPRVGCVNSFGFGGTNAHAIVVQYNTSTSRTESQSNETSNLPSIVTLSALDTASLRENVQNFQDSLKQRKYSLRSLSFTSTCNRDHYVSRKAFVAESQDHLISLCDQFLKLPVEPSSNSINRKLVFVFCGVGTAWKGMCKTLMKNTSFCSAIDLVDRHLQPLTSWTIASKFSGAVDMVANPFLNHIAIFSCQVGLIHMWKSFGVIPVAVIGQSVGEVAAAYASGHIELETAVKIIYHRSKLLAEVTGGGMAFVKNIPTEEVEKFCNARKGTINIAVYNSPVSCTVAGDKSVIAELKEGLKQLNNGHGTFLELDVKCAYHSRHVDKIIKTLNESLKNLKDVSLSSIPMFSTVTGKKAPNRQLGSVAYWVKNVRQPVRFSKAVQEAHLHNNNGSIFIEIGPGPVLRSHLNDIFPDEENITAIPTMKMGDETSSVAKAIGTLFENGVDINWRDVLPPCKMMTDIPSYVFRGNKVLYRNPDLLLENQGYGKHTSNHMYVTRRPSTSPLPTFRATIDVASTPFVFEHVVKENILVPGAFHADIGFELGKQLFQAKPEQIQVGVEFLKRIRVEASRRLTLIILCTDVAETKIEFQVKQKGDTVVKGSVCHLEQLDALPDKLELQQMKFELMPSEYRNISATELYEQLGDLGFKYGPNFRIITQAMSGKDTTVATFVASDEVISETDKTTLHPCILDGMLQSTMLVSDEETLNMIKTENLAFLPVAIERINVLRPLEQKMILYTKRTKVIILETVMKLQFDMVLCNTNGDIVVVIYNYTTYSRRNNHSAPDELKYSLSWKPFKCHPTDTVKRERALIITDIQEFVTDFENETCWIVYRTSSNESDNTFISDILSVITQQWGSIEKLDVIVVLFDKYMIDSTDVTGSVNLYKKMKTNCGLLIALIRFLMTKDIRKPIFISTQNTQCLLGDNDAELNVHGSEVWGLVRSIQTEFVTCPMTMVDLQPSLNENVTALKNLIQTVPEDIDGMKTEIILSNGTLFGAEFSKTAMSDSIPNLCKSQPHGHEFPSKICSAEQTVVQEPYLLPRLDMNIHDLKQKAKNSVVIKITSVFQHSPVFFPQVTPLTSETSNEGYSLLGVEYAGIEIDTGPAISPMCKGSRIEPGNESLSGRWETIAVFPAAMKNYMTVPRSCTVSMREINNVYQPGLLLHTILAMNIVQTIERQSIVALVCSETDSTLVKILQIMLPDVQTIGAASTTESVKNIDTVVILTPHENSLDLIQTARKILYFKGTVLDCILKHLVILDDKQFTEFDLKYVFSQTTIVRMLKASVRWLKKKHSVLAKCLGEKDQSECRSLTVTKNGAYTLPYKVPMSSMFLKSGSYLITGGLTGLGWELLLTIAEMGGGTIATLSRRQPSETQLEEIKEVESRCSCNIVCLQGDVNDFKDVSHTIQTLKSTQQVGHLRGVFHGAGALDSALLLNMQEKHLDKVMGAKIQGTMNLHVATMDMKLDYFIVQSSITSILGVPGQGNYGAANAFLDAFALWRRQKGLAGQSINWGALEVGMAANSDFADMFEKRGYHLLTKAEIRCCFQQALLQNQTGVVFTSLDWNLVSKDYASHQMKRLRLKMANVIQERASDTSDADANLQEAFDVAALRSLDPESQREALRRFLKIVAQRVLESNKDNFPLSASFAEIGMDSMSAVTFSNIVYEMTGCRISLNFMMDQTNTLEDVTTYLMEGLFPVADTNL